MNFIHFTIKIYDIYSLLLKYKIYISSRYFGLKIELVKLMKYKVYILTINHKFHQFCKQNL